MILFQEVYAKMSMMKNLSKSMAAYGEMLTKIGG